MKKDGALERRSGPPQPGQRPWSAAARPHRCARSLLRSALWLGLVLAGTGGKAAEDSFPGRWTDYPDSRFTVNHEVVTPHIPWARPYAGRKLRVLFIVPSGGSRDVVEVAQRLTIQDTAFLTADYNAFYHGGPFARADAARDDCWQELLQASYDVFVLGSVNWDSGLYPERLYTVLERVKKGAGLVATDATRGPHRVLQQVLDAGTPSDAEGLFRHGVPYSLLPVFRLLKGSDAQIADQVARAVTWGKGRVVHLAYPNAGVWSRYSKNSLVPSMTVGDGWLQRPEPWTQHEYEYTYSLVLRAVLWAGRAEPEVQVIAPDSIEGDRVKLAGTEVLIRFSKTTARVVSASLEARLRSRWGETWWSHTVRVRCSEASSHSITLRLPAWLRAGSHFLDLVLRDDSGATVAWGTCPVRLSGDARVLRVVTDQTCVTRPEPLQGEVAFRRGGLQELHLKLRLKDSDERVVWQQDQALQADPGEKLRFSIPTRDVLRIVHRVQAFLDQAGNRIDEVETEVAVSDPRPLEEYQVGVFGGAGGPDLPSLWALRVLAESGVDWDLTSYKFGGTLQSARAGLRTLNYYAHHHGVARGNILVKGDLPGWWKSDERAAAAMAEEVRKEIDRAREGGTTVHHLGDECCIVAGDAPVQDVCNCDACQADFRQFLQHRFGEVSPMNRALGSNFASFEEVSIPLLRQCKDDSDFALWMEQRRRMDLNFAGQYRRKAQSLRLLDPRSQTSTSVFKENPVFGGYDFALLGQVIDHPMPQRYEPLQRRLFRDFLPPDRRPWTVTGVYALSRTVYAPEHHRAAPWLILAEGSHALWFSGAAFLYTNDSEKGWLGDLTPTQSARIAFEEYGKIRSGIGRLLYPLRSPAQVAILYSRDSEYQQAATLGEDARVLQVQMRQWTYLLEEVGLPYRFLSSSQLARGDAKDARCLILPFTQCLSAEEAAAIQSFVQEGGLLISDVQPGVFDGSGRAASPGQLAAVLGVKLASARPLSLASRLCRFPGGQQASVTANLSPVEVAGAQAHASVQENLPAWFTCSFGRGQSLCLNFLFDRYRHRTVNRDDPQGRPDRMPEAEELEILRARLRSAWSPLIQELPFQCIGPDGSLLRNAVLRLEQDGDARYVLLVRDWSDDSGATPTRVTYRVSERLHVYESLSDRYLGQKHSWTDTLQEFDIRFFSLLPYRVKDVRLEGPRSVRRGEVWTCTVTIERKPSSSSGARHVAHVSVQDAAGRERRAYASNVDLPAGLGEFRLPVAHNDPPGLWRVQARDAATRRTGSCVFTVSE